MTLLKKKKRYMKRIWLFLLNVLRQPSCKRDVGKNKLRVVKLKDSIF